MLTFSPQAVQKQLAAAQAGASKQKQELSKVHTVPFEVDQSPSLANDHTVPVVLDSLGV